MEETVANNEISKDNFMSFRVDGVKDNLVKKFTSSSGGMIFIILGDEFKKFKSELNVEVGIALKRHGDDDKIAIKDTTYSGGKVPSSAFEPRVVSKSVKTLSGTIHINEGA